MSSCQPKRFLQSNLVQANAKPEGCHRQPPVILNNLDADASLLVNALYSRLYYLAWLNWLSTIPDSCLNLDLTMGFTTRWYRIPRPQVRNLLQPVALRLTPTDVPISDVPTDRHRAHHPFAPPKQSLRRLRSPSTSHRHPPLFPTAFHVHIFHHRTRHYRPPSLPHPNAVALPLRGAGLLLHSRQHN